jgi:glucokinase
MVENFPRLLGDVGGTNARWAWQPRADAPLQDIAVVPCAESTSLFDSAIGYLDHHGLGRPAAASIGVATAVTGDEIQFTNSSWTFSVSKLKQLLKVDQCIVINDFTALALSLPTLRAEDLETLGGRTPMANRAIGLVGPGTGLGVSGLIPNGHGDYVALSGEGGHVTLSPTDALESSVLEVLRCKFGHVSAERVLSGSGLVSLYNALCIALGVAARDLTPQQVSELALANTDAQCSQTAQLFSSFLGNLAGNLALTLGATGGVYVGGGVVPRLGTAFDRNIFRNRFEDKGRFRTYLNEIPCWLITAATPALSGASRALDLSDYRAK